MPRAETLGEQASFEMLYRPPEAAHRLTVLTAGVARITQVEGGRVLQREACEGVRERQGTLPILDRPVRVTYLLIVTREMVVDGRQSGLIPQRLSQQLGLAQMSQHRVK